MWGHVVTHSSHVFGEQARLPVDDSRNAETYRRKRILLDAPDRYVKCLGRVPPVAELLSPLSSE